MHSESSFREITLYVYSVGKQNSVWLSSNRTHLNLDVKLRKAQQSPEKTSRKTSLEKKNIRNHVAIVSILFLSFGVPNYGID